MSRNRRILAVSPHCDDIELGCGGTLAQAAAAGDIVHVLIMACGTTKLLHAGVVTSEMRKEENDRAFSVLGLTSWKYAFDLDGQLDTLALSEGVTILDEILDRFQPDTVYLPLPSFHQDHDWTFRAGLAACRPSRAGFMPSEVFAYEYPLSSWGPHRGYGNGAMYVDISDYVECKIEALLCHDSQIRPEHNLIGAEAVRALARLRGAEARCEYAEMFHVLRLVRA